MRFSSILLATGVASLLSMSAAAAADMPGKVIKPIPPSAPSAACLETSGLPTDIFGFSSGSDVADLGSWGGSLEYNGAYGTRFGTLSGHNIKAQVSTSPFPCLEIGPSLNYGSARLNNRIDLTSTTATAFGGQIEFKYKILGRAIHGIGLTVSAEPGYSAVNNRLSDPLTPFFGSERSRAASNSFKILTDFALIPDRVYGAFNVEYGQGWNSSETNGLNGCAPAVGPTGGWCRASSFNMRAAVSAKLADNFYLGAEGQYLSAYQGTFLNQMNGHAWFIGPTAFWQATEKFAISGTFATQVAGQARGTPNSLDLTNFSRHVAKLKLGYSF
jgi:hypothetical protein